MKIDEELEIENIRREGKLDKTRLLEVGCGDGRLSFKLANFVKEIIAIDPKKDEITKAKDKINLFKNKNINFYIGKGEKLDFNDNSFDRILYTLAFHHIPIDNQMSALTEANRVLKKGRYLIIYEPLKEGEMQRLFLIFEDELREMQNVYKAITQAEKRKLFKIIKQKKFTITWKFNDYNELIDYFSKMYGKEKVKDNIKLIEHILKNKMDKKPLIINDDLILVVLMVNK